jgi:hypothetical protein
MFSDPIRVADAINYPKFQAGDAVVLAGGPHKYVRGIFLNPKDDVRWASIKEPSGTVTSHPVEWMQSYREPASGSAASSNKGN